METKTQEITRRRFTVEEYHKMGEAGILHEDDRVELIEGEIIEMSPIWDRHVGCVNRLTMLLAGFAGEAGYVVSVQNPVCLNDRVEPQPDLAVLKQDRSGRRGMPSPEDVLLLIEVSDTAVAYDRRVKLPLYARAGIAETWILDPPGEAIERHNDPSGDGYRRMERGVGRGRSLPSEVLPDLVLHADAVLG